MIGSIGGRILYFSKIYSSSSLPNQTHADVWHRSLTTPGLNYFLKHSHSPHPAHCCALHSSVCPRSCAPPTPTMSERSRVAKLGLKLPLRRPVWQRRRTFGDPVGVRKVANVPIARRRRKWVSRDIAHFEQLEPVGEGTYGCVTFTATSFVC